MDEQTKRDFLDLLREIARDSRGGSSSGSAKKTEQATFDLIKAYDKYQKSINKSKVTLDEQIKISEKFSRTLYYEIAAIEDHIDSLEEAGKTAEAQAQREVKRGMIKAQKDAETIAQAAKLKNSFKEAWTNTQNYSDALGGAVKLVSGSLRGLQSNAGAATVANDILTSGVTLAGKMGSSAGSAMETLGSAGMVLAKGPIAKLGSAAVSAAGSLLKVGSPAVAEAMKFALEYLGKEFNNITEGFRKTSMAGAMFSDGMSGMISAAQDANLTLQQFSGVVEKNRDSLVASGLSVSGSMKLLSETSKIIRKEGNEVGRQLNNLGYSFEEQAGLIAETMGDLGRFGGARGMGAEEVTQATLETAKSMKLLAGLAGEDAKSRKEATRRANDEIGFKSKLLQLEQRYGKEYARKVELSMQQLDPNVAAMVREIEKYGQIITPSLSIMANTVPAMGEAAQTFHSQMASGAADIEETVRLQGRANDKIVAQAKEAGGTFDVLGNVRAGIGAETAKVLEPTLTKALNFGSKEAEEQIRKTREQANTQDETTKKFVAAQTEYQKAMVEAQTLAINNMSDYVSLVKGVNSALRTALETINADKKSISEKIMDNIGMILGLIVAQFGGTMLTKLISNRGLPPPPGSLPPSPGSPTPGTPTPAGGAPGAKPTAPYQDASGRWRDPVSGRYTKAPVVATPTVPTAPTGAASAGGAAGTAAKAAGKGLLRFLPGVGLVIGAADAMGRAGRGDYGGAALALGSGVAGLIPGIGSAASIAMSGALIAKDMGAFDSKSESGSETGVISDAKEMAKKTQDNLGKMTDEIKQMNSQLSQLLSEFRNNNNYQKQIAMNTQ